MWRLLDRPAVMVWDARDREEFQACLESPRSTPYNYRIAFHDALDEGEVAKILEWGADDIVAYPANPGELLNRIQTGIRRIEFENRLTQQTSYDPATGATTGSGFVRRLQNTINSKTGKNDSVVIALSIDHQDILISQFGNLVSHMANCTLAGCITEQTTEEDFVASLDDGVFLVYLENSVAREGVQFAELIVREFKAQNVLSPDFGGRISLSGAVLQLPAEPSAEDIVQHTLNAFDHAKHSGGNLIVDANDLPEPFSTPPHQGTQAFSLDGTLTKHVMLPLPFVLPIEEPEHSSSDHLHLFTLHSTARQPPCSVVVDRQARFLGTVQQSYFDELAGGASPSLEEHLVLTTPTADETQPAADLTDLLNAVGSNFLIVLDGEKPVGVVTRDRLTAATSASAGEKESAPEYRERHHLEALVVPEGQEPAPV